jgi:outer membrane protein assembly factor BamB
VARRDFASHSATNGNSLFDFVVVYGRSDALFPWLLAALLLALAGLNVIWLKMMNRERGRLLWSGRCDRIPATHSRHERECFGAPHIRRTDEPGMFHTDWLARMQTKLTRQCARRSNRQFPGGAMRVFVVVTSVVAFGLASCFSACRGDDWPAKTDNEILCLDLRTGRSLWEYKPEKLGDAHFELYTDGLIAYPHYDGLDRSKPIFLDIKTGHPIRPFDQNSKHLQAKSAVFWPGPEVVLENGWRLSGFKPGNSQALTFRDAVGAADVWTIETRGYPHEVRSWKDFILFAFSSYSDKEGILYAYHTGAKKPTWTVDLNRIVKGRKPPLTRMIFQIIDDTIYLEADEHIFALVPASGKLLWHRDLASDLGLQFAPDFYGGALNLAVFAKDGSVLVVSFERRVVAIDLSEGKYLWHFEPDTFPECPFPIAYGDKVVLTSGAKRRLHRIMSNVR